MRRSGPRQINGTRLSNGEALDDLLPEALAVVREAGKRVLEMAISTYCLSAV